MAKNAATVSFENERLLLVNSNDDVIGYETKLAAHLGKGQLHRAFSIFIINEKGEAALQRRSTNKLLWPGYWANSCCSHPREGETVMDAAYRRLSEELGTQTALQWLYKFEYRSEYNDIGTEHELCSVLVGHIDSTSKLNPNQTEIDDISWVDWHEIEAWLNDPNIPTTPWLALEWSHLNEHHLNVVLNF